MELVKVMIDKQEKERIEQERLEAEANKNRSVYGLGGDVKVFIGDLELGTIQMANIESQTEIYELGHMHNDVFGELIGEELRTISMEYTYVEPGVHESRAERRMKARQKHDEELQDQYRRGVRGMLKGSKRRWN
jgi:hypothetical protein